MSRFDRFRQRLRRLGFATYADYLRSPLWRETRRRFLLAHPRCFVCEATIGVLPHHRTYRRLGQERLRDYSRSDLVALCGRCHGLTHRIAKARIAARGIDRERLYSAHADLREHLPHLLTSAPCGGWVCRTLIAGSPRGWSGAD